MALTAEQALDYIHSLDDPYLRAIQEQGNQIWGIDGMHQLLAKLGNPHEAYPTIHVAGTKGKGSVSAFISQGFIESGLTVGLYTSPHLMDWRERIQVDRQWISETALGALVDDFRPHAEGLPITAFEAGTALAFWHFAREKVDVAVIEVGLGGRLDATNVLNPAVSVITSISKDHTQLLGDTLERIAAEKAAIIKQGGRAVSAPQHKAAQSVVQEMADDAHASLLLVGRDWRFKPEVFDWNGSEMEVGGTRRQITVEVGMPGFFQMENAAVALAALNEAEKAGIPVTIRGRLAGLKNARWPGRLEVIGARPRIVLDGAHNPYSVRQLLDSVGALRQATNETRGKLQVVFGCMADKNVTAMLKSLSPKADRVIFARADHSRAADPAVLLEQALTIRANFKTPDLLTAESVEYAVSDMVERFLTEEDTLLITGSLSVVSEARTKLIYDKK